jgi:hypothetical protein
MIATNFFLLPFGGLKLRALRPVDLVQPFRDTVVLIDMFCGRTPGIFRLLKVTRGSVSAAWVGRIFLEWCSKTLLVIAYSTTGKISAHDTTLLLKPSIVRLFMVVHGSFALVFIPPIYNQPFPENRSNVLDRASHALNSRCWRSVSRQSTPQTSKLALDLL